MELLKNAKVETYTLTASNGRTIRKATRVVLANGQVINFTESMGKAEAIRNAAYELKRRSH